MTSRRGFLLGLGSALITAPAIVRVGNIMPVRSMLDIVNDGVSLVATEHPGSAVVSLAEIREMLLPGLWEVSRAYGWDNWPGFGAVLNDDAIETMALDSEKLAANPRGLRILGR